MDQGRRLKRLPGLLMDQLMCCEFAELVIQLPQLDRFRTRQVLLYLIRIGTITYDSSQHFI
jgi:hypothetical protein